MIPFLVSFMFLVQGIPALPGQSGAITGILKTEKGEPASGVRVSIMAKPDNPTDLVGASALMGLAETDDDGRFRIENIPPGSYYVVAGRVDLPTYYPGTGDLQSGKLISIAAGATVSGVDFAMKDTSVRVAGSMFGSLLSTAATVTVRFRVEGGEKLPVSYGNGITTIRLTSTADGRQTDLPLNVSKSISQLNEYRVSVENLPDNYTVKSVMYGSTDLTTSPLKVLNPNLTVVSRTPNPALGQTSVVPPPPLPTAVGAAIAQIIVLSSTVSTASNFTMTTVIGAPVVSPAELIVTLVRNPRDPGTQGVRVRGRARASEIRPVYLSGTPGVLYADGTFEFDRVQPGRHIIATVDSPGRALGASIVVGSEDLSGVELGDVPILPADLQQPRAPGPAGNHAVGTTIPLPSIRGYVADATSMEPLAGAFVNISGSKYFVELDGRFEITRLLPGRYDVEILSHNHNTVAKTIVVDDTDIEVDWRVP